MMTQSEPAAAMAWVATAEGITQTCRPRRRVSSASLAFIVIGMPGALGLTRLPARARRVRRDVAAEVDHYLVDVAPTPALGLEVGFHHGMPGGVEVRRRVAADGLVATADVAADAADAKVNPRLADFQALLAAVRGRRDAREHAEVGAAHGRPDVPPCRWRM